MIRRCHGVRDEKMEFSLPDLCLLICANAGRGHFVTHMPAIHNKAICTSDSLRSKAGHFAASLAISRCPAAIIRASWAASFSFEAMFGQWLCISCE